MLYAVVFLTLLISSLVLLPRLEHKAIVLGILLCIIAGFFLLNGFVFVSLLLFFSAALLLLLCFHLFQVMNQEERREDVVRTGWLQWLALIFCFGLEDYFSLNHSTITFGPKYFGFPEQWLLIVVAVIPAMFLSILWFMRRSWIFIGQGEDK